MLVYQRVIGISWEYSNLVIFHIVMLVHQRVVGISWEYSSYYTGNMANHGDFPSSFVGLPEGTMHKIIILRLHSFGAWQDNLVGLFSRVRGRAAHLQSPGPFIDCGGIFLWFLVVF